MRGLAAAGTCVSITCRGAGTHSPVFFFEELPSFLAHEHSSGKSCKRQMHSVGHVHAGSPCCALGDSACWQRGCCCGWSWAPRVYASSTHNPRTHSGVKYPPPQPPTHAHGHSFRNMISSYSHIYIVSYRKRQTVGASLAPLSVSAQPWQQKRVRGTDECKMQPPTRSRCQPSSHMTGREGARFQQ